MTKVTVNTKEQSEPQHIFFPGNLITYSNRPEWVILVICDEDYSGFAGLVLSSSEGSIRKLGYYNDGWTKVNAIQFVGSVTLESE